MENRPVMNVNWFDVIAYCNWLSETNNEAKAYNIEGKLLDKNVQKSVDNSISNKAKKRIQRETRRLIKSIKKHTSFHN